MLGNWLRTEEWVRSALGTYGSERAVAWNHLGLVRQFEQARVDRFDDLFGVSAGKIGAADASGEECVPGNEHIKRCEMEAHRSLRVARGINHLRGVVFESHGLAVNEAFIGERDFRCGDAEPPSLLVHHLEQGKVVLVQKNGSARQSFELERASDVVDVGVGDEDLPQFEAKLAQPSVNAGDLVSGIDHNRFARGFVAEKRAVALERADREGLEDHSFILEG